MPCCRAARNQAVAWAEGGEAAGLVEDADATVVEVCPPAPPTRAPPPPIGCGPECRQSHSHDGPCLVCGQGWGSHSGHTCNADGFRGMRGSWIVGAASERGDY